MLLERIEHSFGGSLKRDAICYDTECIKAVSATVILPYSLVRGPGSLHVKICPRYNLDKRIMDVHKKQVSSGAGKSGKELPFRPRGSSLKDGASQPSKNDSPPESLKNSENVKASNPQVKTVDGKTTKTESGSKQMSSNTSAMSSLPDFIIKRNELFDELKRKRDAELLEKDHQVISVVLDLGVDMAGRARPAMPVAAKLGNLLLDRFSVILTRILPAMS